MPSRNQSRASVPPSETSIAMNVPSEDSEQPAKQPTEKGAVSRGTKTRARNKKILEEQQLQEATSVLATPRSAKVKALNAAVWVEKKTSQVAATGSKAVASETALATHRKRALSSSAATQTKEPTKKKSKSNLVQAPDAKAKGTSSRRLILPRHDLEDDEDIIEDRQSEAIQLEKPIITGTRQKASKQKVSISANEGAAKKKKAKVNVEVASEVDDELEESGDSGSEFQNSSASGDAASGSEDESSEDDDADDDVDELLMSVRRHTSSTPGSAPPSSIAPSSDDEHITQPQAEEQDSDWEGEDVAISMPKTAQRKSSSGRSTKHKHSGPGAKLASATLQDERPRFRPAAALKPSDDAAAHSDDGEDEPETMALRLRRGKRNAENLLAWEQQYPEDTRLVYDTRSRVAMNSQSSVIKGLLSAAIEEFKIKFAFDRPTADSSKKSIQQRGVLIKCAKSLKRSHIVDRLKTDEVYVRDLAAVAEQRVTKLRGDIRKGVAPLIKDHYKLKPGTPYCKEQVAKLLDDMEYIYPGDTMKNTMNYNEPFDIPIIHTILGTWFFDGPKSLAAQNRRLFKSSDPKKPNELEIPEGMLIATLIIIFHCLEDWTSGAYKPGREFQLSMVHKEYVKIIEYVEALLTEQPKMYHRVMHKVFVKTCALKDVDLVSKGSSHRAAFSKLVLDDDNDG